MAVLLRMDNIVKEHSSSIAFTEENILLTYMSSPYLFCASLFYNPENINCLGSQRGSHYIIFLSCQQYAQSRLSPED